MLCFPKGTTAAIQMVTLRATTSHRMQIPGGDVAGVVVEADESSPIKPGTRAAFMSEGYRCFRPYASYAEFITVPEGQVAVLPDGVDVDAAAVLPLVSLTIFLMC